ncbi:MAG: phosphoribosylanthranilate isomerase [Candidatus Korobacteraceae bacterium]
MWIKICGTTNLADARASLAAGASALGFILAPSPRRVDIPTAFDIVKALGVDVETVGVFVDEHPRRLGEIVSQIPFTGVQLHGNEPPELMKEFRQVLGGRQIIKTLQAADLIASGGVKLESYLAKGGYLDAILLDSGSADQPGGTGKPFAWEQVKPLAAKIREAMPLIIAGGLNAENVAEAIAVLEPWGVDVVSGVEFEPGKKSTSKLRSFVAAVRQAESSGKQTG